jgi:type VI secretion system protein ImpK
MIMEHNALLDCARPVFQKVSWIKRDSASLPEDFFDQAQATFLAFERDALQAGVNSRMVHEAKYALVAFVDELVVGSTWTKKAEWMSQPLQLALFGEHLAGEGFYQHLSDLRQFGAQFIDALEIYYLCLQLGFMGKYRLQQKEVFLGLQADLRSQIEATRGVGDGCLSASLGAQTSGVMKVNRLASWWVLVGVPFVIIVLMYVGFSFSINGQLGDRLAEMRATNHGLMGNLSGSVRDAILPGYRGQAAV